MKLKINIARIFSEIHQARARIGKLIKRINRQASNKTLKEIIFQAEVSFLNIPNLLISSR